MGDTRAVGRDEDGAALLGDQAYNAETLKTYGPIGDRTQAYLVSLKNVDGGPVLQALGCFLKYLAKPLIIVLGIYVYIAKSLYQVYLMLPLNVIHCIFGIGLCFFGGVYFAAIAAVEAFRQFGGAGLWNELTILWNEATNVAEASRLDDAVDADQNNIADVQEMDYNTLINHKAKVALMAVKDPQSMTKAMQFVFTTWLTVLATLKCQFAQTVALCLGVTEMLELPVVKIVGPVLTYAMGPDLNNWVAPTISTTLKVIAVIVASYVQSIISAFYSGIRGGRMFAEGLINIASEHGLMDKLPDWIAKKPFNPNESYLDELIAYPLAAYGFYHQFNNKFEPEFPWSMILLPVTIIDEIIHWQVFTA